MGYMECRMKRPWMIAQEAVEMSKIAWRFLAWATGRMNLGTLNEFGGSGDHNCNLRIKIKTHLGQLRAACHVRRVTWGSPTAVTSLLSVMGAYTYILQQHLEWDGLHQLGLDSAAWPRALLRAQRDQEGGSTVFACRGFKIPPKGSIIKFTKQ